MRILPPEQEYAFTSAPDRVTASIPTKLAAIKTPPVALPPAPEITTRIGPPDSVSLFVPTVPTHSSPPNTAKLPAVEAITQTQSSGNA
ncbi:unnamed protein product [Sphagnum balticum]